ncbi:exocyst complex component 7 isoform X2 [Morone saxatilis]|nr:exocyst complex component 7 isoform X2 [Morone saxatilis]
MGIPSRMIPTEDASARKREIEEKLKQEQETLSFIRENLEKSDQLTKGMVSILSSFESRLMQLENSIIPVHKQTENLQRLQENVDKTLSCMDHVISYYHVAKDTDRIIREGPTGRLDEYLACIAKIQKAVEYFQDNNPDSPELNTVKARFEKGKELLEAEFRSLLTRYSKPVPPILILDAISVDEELEVQEDVVLEHLPEAVLQDIICIAGWLVEYGRNQDFMNVYFQIRSNQLDRSIKGLKDHFRKNSASSGILYSPAVQTKRKDTPTKKAPKRPVYIPGKDDVLDIEIDSYIHCISAFVKLAHSEYSLLAEIIPEHHQKKTFDSLIQEALDNLMLEGDNIVSAARRAIMRHDYSAVLTIFPILRHLKINKSDFDTTLQGTAASTKNKLPTLITSMETIGAKALEEFADSIKNDPDKEYNMPKDGTVHELTSNAILFLQQLLDFHETAGAMLASQETSSASSYTSDFNKKLLSTYICKVLGNLQLNLLSKSKVYEDSALSAIFLHNNYNYILKSLEK